MSGIDTSRGINSVASTIAALQANGTQVVTTNTGAHVTGLEAAAYEFGSILASYPADAPPLTRNAAVFQVTDANGNTSMVSLNDLADDIRTQTGYDPLIEFSASFGNTNQGYSVADINSILSQIENQYSSMSFTQLAQVQGNADLVVSGNVDAQVQGAINQLQAALSQSQSSISQALAASPGGVGLDAAVITNPNSPEAQANARALAQVANQDSTIAADLNNVAQDQAALNASQNTYLPADQAAIAAAQGNVALANAALAAATVAAAGTLPPQSFLQNLLNGLNNLSSVMSQGGKTLDSLAASNPNDFMVGANLLQGTPESPNDVNQGNYTVTTFKPLPQGYSLDTITDFSGRTWEQCKNDGFNDFTQLAHFLANCTIPNYSTNLDSYTIHCASMQTGSSHLGQQTFSGLMSACGVDPNNPAQVATFNAQLEVVMPGASTQSSFTLSQIETLKATLTADLPRAPQTSAFDNLAIANQNYNNALSALQTAQTNANNHQLAAINSAQQTLQAATAKLTADQGALTTLLSTAMASTTPAAVSLQDQITSQNTIISNDQANIVSLQTQIINIQNNASTAATLETNLGNTLVALSMNPGDATAQANETKAKAALQAFLGGTFATVADARAACDQYIQTQNGLLTGANGLNGQLTVANNTLQADQATLQSLQNQLLNLSTESFNQLLSDIQSQTGIDLGQALTPIIGNGPMTLFKLNEVYKYLNQQLPAAQQFPLLTNAQFIQATGRQIASLFTQPGFTQALANSPNGIDPNAAIFTLPGSNSPISFNDALNLIGQGSGVDPRASMNAILNGGPLNQQAVNNIKRFCANPAGVNAPSVPMAALATDPATGQSVSISGAKAAEFNFANQLNQVDFLALANAGSPINADAAIFISTDANGGTTDISFNQLIQNYNNQGYNLSSILPPGINTFTVADLGLMINRLNADQDQAAFRVADNAVLNQGLAQIKNQTSSDSAMSITTMDFAANLLSALGVQNPKQIYLQAVLASQITALENTPGIRPVENIANYAVSGNQNLVKGQPGVLMTVNSALGSVANALGFDINSEAAWSYYQQDEQGAISQQYAFTSSSFDDLITQLNKANRDTPFVINNLFIDAASRSKVDVNVQLNLSSFVPPAVNSNLATHLANNFAAFDLNSIPEMTVSNSVGFDQVANNLDSFTVSPGVQNALGQLGQALMQLQASGLDANGNLAMNNAVFNMPNVAQSLGRAANTPVSLSEIFTYQSQTLGINLQQAIPNLTDSSGKISSGNLASLIEIINQGVPDSRVPVPAAVLGAQSRSGIDLIAVKTNLQNIQFEDVNVAVQSGAASAAVAASATEFNPTTSSILTSAELNAQLEGGDLYVNTRGQFFLNRQPTNPRDASVAAMVIGSNKQNAKLNDLMNKVNVNNTNIQMASTLSTATSVSDLRNQIASMKAQYGYSDVLSQITGGALSDNTITDSTDISGATGAFQSTLKTAINNATKNQDLDTQSLQQLTSQIQANNTAMTQMIQAFEQLLKSLAQNF